MAIDLEAPVEVDKENELVRVLKIRKLGCLALDVSIRAFEIRHASQLELSDLAEKVARMSDLLHELTDSD